MRSRLAATGAALVIGLSGAAVATAPAEAASTFTQICNSTDGTQLIRAWKTDNGYTKNLYPTGQCTGDLYNANNSVRVDTREAYSYKIKPIGIGYSGTYGPWHCNGGIIDSDPPNASQVYYKTSVHNEC